MNLVALKHYLKAFQPYLEMEQVTDICVNRPHEIWAEQKGSFKKFEPETLSKENLWKLAQLVAESNHRDISPGSPALSSVLPNGLRVQFVVEPACEQGQFICAVRQKSLLKASLPDYFRHTEKTESSDGKQLMEAYLKKDHVNFLRLAVLQKKNIIISGGTSTGKTTCLNTLVEFVPLSERLVTIETDREVILKHENAVHLLSAEGKGHPGLSMQALLEVALRLRPDRILLSELRGKEAFPYLRAINSGHPGSLTTMHADTPMACFDQLAFMVMQAGTTLSMQDIVAYAKSIINVIVQIKKSGHGGRYISDIYFDEAVKGQNPFNKKGNFQ